MLARDAAQKIEPIIAPTVEHLGYELVRVMMIGTARLSTLQIMAEPKVDASGTRRQMTVEDCETISRNVSAVLDVADPIAAKYNLEVSSPGIDRPLTRLADFERFRGHLATLDLRQPNADGRKRFQGELAGANEGAHSVRLTVDGPSGKTEQSFSFEDIAKAKLVLTDKLINAGISN